MNLKQRYRGSIYRRTIKFIISYSFLFCMLFYTNTYSKFATTQAVTPQAGVAKWEVDISADGVTNNTVISLVTNNSLSGLNKIHPGSTGYFDLVINPNNTEVSVNYTITFSNLPDGLNITSYEILENNQANPTIVTNNTIKNDIVLNQNKEALTSSDAKTLRVYWQIGDILLDVDELLSGGDLRYTIDVAVTARQKLEDDIVNAGEVNIKYVFAQDTYFNHENYINTGIQLFSAENKDKDFEITANIVSEKANSNTNTFVTCMNEAGNPYQGFAIFYNYTGTPTVRNWYYNANVSLSDKRKDLLESAISSVKLVKTNNVLYYDINNTGLIEDRDFSDITAFNSSLIFGAALNGNLQPFRNTTSRMSDLTLKYPYSLSLGTITLPNPVYPGYAFGGWYSDSAFTNKIGDGGSTYNLSDDIVLYAKWIQNDQVDSYINQEGLTDSYVNTHVYLFSEENIHRNFELSFDLSNFSYSTTDYNHIIDISNVIHLSARTKSGVSTYGMFENYIFAPISFYNTGTNYVTSMPYIPLDITSFKLIRINDVLYYSINGQDLIRFANNLNPSTYSNAPVLIGARLGDYGETVANIIKGTISNINVKFIGNNATVADYGRNHQELVTVYSNAGPVSFNGTSDYIVPTTVQYPNGLTLMDMYNYDKDFEVSFTIDSMNGSNSKNTSTIFNLKLENDLTWPGIAIKYNNSTNLQYSSRNGEIAKQESTFSVTLPQTIKITRTNRVIRLYKNNTLVQTFDYSNLCEFHDIPLSFGCTFNGKVNPPTVWRCFAGTLSNIVVKVEP